MENMKKVAKVLEMVRKTSSTNAKQAILQHENKQEYGETLRNVLYYTYNPFMMFGLTEKTLQVVRPNIMTYAVAREEDVFLLLEELANNNINDHLRSEAKRLLLTINDDEVRKMVQGIMVKDLKLGVNVTTLNKVFGKGFIPKFDVQLAESYDKIKKETLQNKPIWITQKYDGTRIVYDSTTKTFYTRNGKVYEGLEHLVKECDALCDLLGEKLSIKEQVVLDGELVHKPVDGMNSQDLFALTSGIARKKGKVKEKENLQFHVFDVIPAQEFRSGCTTFKYSVRRSALDLVFIDSNFKNVIHVPVLYDGIYDENVVVNLLKQMEKLGNEGLMINLDKAYETRRTKSLIKVKSFNDADVLVTGILEGTGKNLKKLGSIVIKFLYNGQEKYCNVGSGFTDEQREYYWKHPEEIIGKIIVINYFEITTNKDGEVSLRFPTFTGEIRFDKDDISDLGVIK